MARETPIPPSDLIWKQCSFDDIADEARELGVIKRQRTLRLLPFLLTILFSSGPLAELRRRYATLTEVALSRASWLARFSTALLALVQRLAGRLIERSLRSAPSYQGLLASFRDVVAIDATTINLHSRLRQRFKSTTPGAAALKVHTRIRALTGELLRYRITSATCADANSFGVDWRDTGKLFLMDMAYCGASLWHCIDRVGAFFATRLPASYDPIICANNQAQRGRSRSIVAKRLREVLPGLRRKVLDCMCEVRVHIQGYGGKRGRYETHVVRIVGIFNEDEGHYHLYATNLPVKLFAAQSIARLYRVRWEVELFYRLGKGILGLDHLSTLKDAVKVRIMVVCALIRHSLTMQARCVAAEQVEALGLSGRINPEMWGRVFYERLRDRLVLEMLGVLEQVTKWSTLVRMALDPNRKRRPLRDTFSFELSGLALSGEP